VRLSKNRRKYKNHSIILKVILVSVYIDTMVILMALDKMYVIEENNIRFTYYFNIHLLFGVAATIYCLVIAIKEKKYISKLIFWGTVLTVPFELIILGLQFFIKMNIFSSVTYVLPFVLFYMLFHSNPYNEIIGCQNEYSFDTRFTINTKHNKRFMIVHIAIEKMYSDGLIEEDEQREELIVDKCRAAENAIKHIHIYSLENGEYALFIELGRNTDKDGYINKIHSIMDEQLEHSGRKISVSYRMTVMESNKCIDDTKKLYAFLRYILKKYEQGISRQLYVCSEDDYQEFLERYKIEKLLLDIRNNNDFDDERVLCYVQPIYSVENDSFRTAEALMRLKDGDEIIYPDKFIPVAEQTGCIHILTCIMMTKVCKEIAKLEKEGYVFDGISVNCSTIELCEPHFHTELSEIIKNNNVSCNKIRLELTESTSVENYGTVYQNMEKLNTKGIEFYLDDFGTGYSNLERIVTFPFMTVKFDKSILYKAIDDENMNALVESMVSVFKEKGLILLVEGVENEEHYEYSVEHGFDYIQGYKYAKPVPIEKLTEYFKTGGEQ
jgi:EAL domain-containing protein (putative c-di-GMP-specific phosphodiesterase class I)